MAVVFVNIAHVFREFGVGSYVVREPELTSEKLRSAIGVLFTSSWIIAFILFFGSGFIASWFNEPKMVPVIQVLSLGFLFTPFGSITSSLLTRGFEAYKQAKITAIATLTYTVTCLGLAWLGFGTMSLAWANLANIVVTGLACIPLRPKDTPWFPSFRKWRGVIDFGLGSLLSNCSAEINNSLPDILLGKLSGARAVGLTSRANSTVNIFGYIAGATVNYGALTYVSQAHQRGESLTPLLNRAISLLTGTGWPVLGVTAIFAKEIITALYGATWLESAEIIPLLAIAGMISMAFNYTPTALTALGRVYVSAVPTVITMVVRIVAGISLFDGTLLSFAWALLIANIAVIPIMLFQQIRYLSYSSKAMAIAIWPSAIVTVACTLAAVLLKLIMLPQLPAALNLAIAAIPLTAVWYGTIRIIKHPLTVEIDHFMEAIKSRLFSRSKR